MNDSRRIVLTTLCGEAALHYDDSWAEIPGNTFGKLEASVGANVTLEATGSGWG